MKKQTLQSTRSTHSIDAIYAFSSPPSPSIPYQQPPIFLAPSMIASSPFPSPLLAPLPSPSHSLPHAAIVGGSVAGGVAAVAVTAAVISGITGKAGLLSCVLAPLVRLLACLFRGVSGPCAKLDSLCRKLQGWRRQHKKDDAHSDKASDGRDNDVESDIAELLEVIVGGDHSPEAVGDKAEATAGTASHSNRLHPSAEELLAKYVTDFMEAELKKHTQSVVEPLNQKIMTAQGYLETLYAATSTASDELRALKGSAQTYLHEAGKLKASAEQLGKADVAAILDEAIVEGMEKVKQSAIAAECAVEMRRLQKLPHEPAVILDEEMLLKIGLLDKAPPPSSFHGGGEAEHHEESSKQHTVHDGKEEMGAPSASTGGAHGSDLRFETTLALVDVSRKPDEGSTAPVPSTLTADSQDGEKQTTVPIVNQPTKAMAPAPPMTKPLKAGTTVAAPAASTTTTGKPTRQGKPTNLGHVSFTCEISAHRLRFFSSCRSGGNYGSPPPTPNEKHQSKQSYASTPTPHEKHDLNQISHHYKGHHHMDQMQHQSDQKYNINSRNLANYSRGFGPSTFTYNSNSHMGLLTNSNAPINEHYYSNNNVPIKHYYCEGMNAQDHQPVTIATFSHQIPLPITSISNSNPHRHTSDYGCPFDGVL